MSVGTKIASPKPSSSFIACSARSSLISATTTLAPSARNRLAYANPMPCPAPVMTATRSCSRGVTSSASVDQVHASGQHELAVLVAVLVLGDEERHRLVARRLLVEVDHLALALDAVADDDRLVVRELLLAVQDDPARGHQLADDLHR